MKPRVVTSDDASDNEVFTSPEVAKSFDFTNEEKIYNCNILWLEGTSSRAIRMRPAPDPLLFEAPLVYSLHALGLGVRSSLAFEDSGMPSTLGLLATSGVALIFVGVSAKNSAKT
ncbi:hypothetical protein Tco_0823860 [Tanacetum coccineum]|uniref:Uncharacterized protein n=1 Tax=Tanacetum coccineum TaxID=301880 RepID=A0ABQ5AJ30_9ASTR